MRTRRLVAHLVSWALFAVDVLWCNGCVAYRAKRLSAAGKGRQALALLDEHFAFLPEIRGKILQRLGRRREAYDMVTLGLARKVGNRRHLVLLAGRLAVEAGLPFEAMEWFESARRSGYRLGRADRKQAWSLWVEAARRLLASSDVTGAIGALVSARRFDKSLPHELVAEAITTRVAELLRWSGLARADDAAKRLAAEMGFSADGSGGGWGVLLDLAKRAGREGPASSNALLRLCHERLWAAAADALQKRLPFLVGSCGRACSRIAVCGLDAASRLGRSGLERALSPLLRSVRWHRSDGLVTALRRLCRSASSLHAPSCSLLRRMAFQPFLGRSDACEAYLEVLGDQGGVDERLARFLWSEKNRRAKVPCGLLNGSWRLALGPVGPWSAPSWGGFGSVAQGAEDGVAGNGPSSRADSAAVERATKSLPDGMVALEKARQAGRFGDVVRIADSMALDHRTDPLVRLELGRLALMMGKIEAALAHLHWAEALAQGPLHVLVAGQVRRLEAIALRMEGMPGRSVPGASNSDEAPGPGGGRGIGQTRGLALPAQFFSLWVGRDRVGLKALARTVARRAVSWASSTHCAVRPGSAAYWAPRFLVATGLRREAAVVLEALVVRGASICRWPWVWRTFRRLGLVRYGARLSARLLELFPLSREVLLSRVALSSSEMDAAGQLADRDLRWHSPDRTRAAAGLTQAWLRAGRCEQAGRALGFFLERLGRSPKENSEAVRLAAWFDARCRHGQARGSSLPYDALGVEGSRKLGMAALQGARSGGGSVALELKITDRWPRLAFSVAFASKSYREAAIQAFRWRRMEPLSSEPLCALARVAIRSKRFTSARALLDRARVIEPVAGCIVPALIELDLSLGRWDSAALRFSFWLLSRGGSWNIEDAVFFARRWIDAGKGLDLVGILARLARTNSVGADRLVDALLRRTSLFRRHFPR